jgi:hypothetical protein
MISLTTLFTGVFHSLHRFFHRRNPSKPVIFRGFKGPWPEKSTA